PITWCPSWFSTILRSNWRVAGSSSTMTTFRTGSVLAAFSMGLLGAERLWPHALASTVEVLANGVPNAPVGVTDSARHGGDWPSFVPEAGIGRRTVTSHLAASAGKK